MASQDATHTDGSGGGGGGGGGGSSGDSVEVSRRRHHSPAGASFTSQHAATVDRQLSNTSMECDERQGGGGGGGGGACQPVTGRSSISPTLHTAVVLPGCQAPISSPAPTLSEATFPGCELDGGNRAGRTGRSPLAGERSEVSEVSEAGRNRRRLRLLLAMPRPKVMKRLW